MIRTYATLAESLQVARYFISKGVTDIKAELLKSNYQVKLNGNVRNVDYKLVEAMVYAIASCAVTEPKPKRKAKVSAIPAV